MKKQWLHILFVLLGASALRGQDMHFSQFNENPSLLNPALAGGEGIRASISYRNQWRSVSTPYKTYGFSYEMRLPPFSKKRGAGVARNSGATKPGKFGVGLSAYKDKIGDGTMSLTQANLAIAYFMSTGEKSTLSLGVITSYNLRRFDDSKYIFPNQYVGTGYDPGAYSGEAFQAQRFSYLDFAGGILWTYGDEERRIRDQKHVKARIGASAYHLTQPAQKYMARGSDKLPMKYVAHGDFHISIQNSAVAIAPAFLFQMQGTNMDILAGSLVKYYVKTDTKYTGYVKRTAYCIGAYYRNQDAAIIQALLEWEEQYAIGLSYDLNISPLSRASGMRGGLELTLRYNAANTFLYQKLR